MNIPAARTRVLRNRLPFKQRRFALTETPGDIEVLGTDLVGRPSAHYWALALWLPLDLIIAMIYQLRIHHSPLERVPDCPGSECNHKMRLCPFALCSKLDAV